MYLRAAKTEAEAAGESTEGMASSTSKLREELLDLTGQKVDIQLDEDTFKSTYQILKELASVWGELSDISRANILEKIGGKRNANVTSALLEQFDLVEDVLNTSANSAGSALAENEKYLDSIQGHISKFKASFEAMSETAINSDLVKTVIDLGTGFLNAANAVMTLIDKLGGLDLILKSFVGFKAIDIFGDLTNGKSISDALVKILSGEPILKSLGYDPDKSYGKVIDTMLDAGFEKIWDVGQAFTNMWNAASDGANKATGFLNRAEGALTGLLSVVNPLKAGFVGLIASFVAVSVLWEGYNTLIEKQNQKFDDSIASYKDSAKSLETYKTEISTLKRVLADQSSSTTEIASANERLLEIENDLLSTYSTKAAGLDLVAASANGTAEAIDNLIAVEAREALSDNKFKVNEVTSAMERERSFESLASFSSMSTEALSDIQEVFNEFGYEIKRDAGGTLLKMTLKDEASDLVDNTKLMREALIKLRNEYAKAGKELDIDSVLQGLSGISTQSQRVLQEYGSDYNEILEWKIQSGSATDSTGEMIEFKDILDEVTYAQEEYNKAVSGSYTSEAERNKAINDALENLNAVEDKINSMHFKVEDLGVKNNFIDIIDSIWSYVDADAGSSMSIASKSVSDYSTSISGLKTEYESLNTAIKEQAGTGSISLETYNSLVGAAEEYAYALEYEAGSYRINIDTANAYYNAKVAAESLELSGKILQETKAYERNNDELEKLTKEYDAVEDKRSKQARDIKKEITTLENQQETIQKNITSYKLLRSQLLEMNSAYAKWQAAQDAPESGDMYDNLKTARDQIKEALKTGKTGTEKYKTAVEMLVTLEDPSPKEVQEYMTKLNRYITNDSSGAKNFINDMINKGLMESSTGGRATWENAWFKDADITIREICDIMKITPSMAKAIFGELEEYHFDFKWTDEDFDMLAIEDIVNSLDAGIAKYKTELEANPEIAPEIDPSDFDAFVNKAKNSFESLLKLDPEVEPMAFEKAKEEFESVLSEGVDLGLDMESLGFSEELLSGLGITIQSNEAVVEIERTKSSAEELKESLLDLAKQTIGTLGAEIAEAALASVKAQLDMIEATNISDKSFTIRANVVGVPGGASSISA